MTDSFFFLKKYLIFHKIELDLLHVAFEIERSVLYKLWKHAIYLLMLRMKLCAYFIEYIE